MPKSLFFMLSTLIFMTQTYGMEMDIEQQPSSKIYWLASLPEEIIKLIEHFLLPNIHVETKEEFINRTKCMIYGNTPLIYAHEGKSTFSAYCPNRDKCAYLTVSRIKNKFFNIDNQHILFTILDEKNDHSLYQENLPEKEYKSIGLSQDGNIFATIHVEHDVSGDFCTDVPRYKSILTIKNIISRKNIFFTLHDHFHDAFGFNSPTLAFNTQGTLLAIHYYNDNKPQDRHNNTRQSKREYKIFKNVKTSYIDAPNNQLNEYLKSRGICKSLTQQINALQ